METISSAKTFNNSNILRFITDPRFRIFRHLVLILLLAAGILNRKVEFPQPIDFCAKAALFTVLLSLFYINMYILVPRLLFKDNYLGYFLWIIVISLMLQFITFFTRQIALNYLGSNFTRSKDGPNLFAYYFILIILIGASAAVKLFQRWIADSQRINELEKITFQAELENLKKQINPHFLFNTLNNVNVLTQRDPQRAAQVVIKLSDLLRYQLYDSTRAKVLLTSDIRFLDDFLNLEKIRRDNFVFKIMQNGELHGLEIAPLLFITFVENAVKHNMDAERESYVYITFSKSENELHFQCINSIPEIKVPKGPNGGLGLVNVKRRLELLYPDSHKLSIADNGNTFNVGLTITL